MKDTESELYFEDDDDDDACLAASVITFVVESPTRRDEKKALCCTGTREKANTDVDDRRNIMENIETSINNFR
jgi:hypothetical protein